jgi:hypothetical protein
VPSGQDQILGEARADAEARLGSLAALRLHLHHVDERSRLSRTG